MIAAFTALCGVSAHHAAQWYDWKTLYQWAIESGSARKIRCLVNIAAYYKLHGDFRTAAKYYHIALRVNPLSAGAMCDLADIYGCTGDRRAAIRILEECTRNVPEWQPAHMMLAHWRAA
jgi:tetratricopeptide (TPR) repeat protein